MEQSIDVAKAALADPPAELKRLLQDERVPEVAREGLKEASPALATSNGGKSNGTSTPLPTGRLQVVDENQNFTSDLSASLRQWGLLDKGFAYDVVAVFGSQSTGKSTLLNRLFGTQFEVMDESKRQQTTKGIWMSPSAYSSTLVMDVEGTDGRERGEDQDFERKSALFSLASTEVLLVNLWEHQIGLYQGANMGLLKTVFEVNLGLFGGKSGTGASSPSGNALHEKTLLLFVIRDHVGATPMANLTATLTQDMERIWASLSKPEHLAEATIHDYFDLSFATLPHKILMPEKFETEVQELRKRFVDRSREDYVFKPAYHKRIPADGVGFYMDGIWQQVLTNKDLDLPTQQELLAQFRCDEISTVVLEAFHAASKAVRRPVEGGSVIAGLGGMMEDWRTTAMAKFDKDASRYHAGVYARKRADLVAAVDSALSPLYLGQLKNLHKQAVVKFREDVTTAIKGGDSYDFGAVVRGAKEAAERGFIEGAGEARLKETSWQHDDELALLREDVKLIGAQLRADETKKMVNAIERNIRKQLADPVEVALAKPRPEMWDDVMRAFKEVQDRALETYRKKAHSFNCTPEEDAHSIDVLQRRAWQSLRRKIGEQLSDAAILGKLRSSFEDKFRYDAGGIPRVWRPEDDIDGAFKSARDSTVALIPLYSKISVTDPSLEVSLAPNSESADTSLDPEGEFDFPDALTILSETKKLDIEQRFRKDADAYYVEAKRSTVSSVASIPLWMYGVLVVLGWNEFMVVLFNPLYFAMLAVLGATGYIILQLGLLGPIIQISKKVIAEAKQIATDKLREAFAPPEQPQRVRAHENTGEPKREMRPELAEK